MYSINNMKQKYCLLKSIDKNLPAYGYAASLFFYCLSLFLFFMNYFFFIWFYFLNM